MRSEATRDLYEMWSSDTTAKAFLAGCQPIAAGTPISPSVEIPRSLNKPAMSSAAASSDLGKGSSWTLPAGLPDELDGDSCEEIDPQKKRARAAQAKFRAKQKERKQDTEMQMKHLMEQLQQVTLDNKYLEYRNRRLQKELSCNDAHLNQLSSHTAVRQVEQQLVLESLIKFMNTIDGRGMDQESLDAAKTWSLHDLEAFFQRYVLKLGSHLQAHAMGQPAALAELTKMVDTRRHHLCLDPWYSNLYWVVLSWNLRQQEQTQEAPPGRHQWAQLLTRLQLTPEQQQKLLTARQCLLSGLAKIGKKRSEIIGRLGLQALECPGEGLASCAAAKDFAANITCERATVLDFMFVIADDILTPQQEATCEAMSYPWHPDFLEMSHILAGRHGMSLELPESLEHLQTRSPGLSKLMPMISPFELLLKPLTTHGIGMALKRSILMCPWQTTAHSPFYRTLPLEKMRQMTLFHAHFGRFEDLIFSVCAVELPAEARRVLDSPLRGNFSPPPSPAHTPASPQRDPS